LCTTRVQRRKYKNSPRKLALLWFRTSKTLAYAIGLPLQKMCVHVTRIIDRNIVQWSWSTVHPWYRTDRYIFPWLGLQCTLGIGQTGIYFSGVGLQCTMYRVLRHILDTRPTGIYVSWWLQCFQNTGHT
jgi:uncharacterized membrane protein